MEIQEMVERSDCIYTNNIQVVVLWTTRCRDQSRYAPNQWETSLHCNDVSHWLGVYLDWSLVSCLFSSPKYTSLVKKLRELSIVNKVLLIK